MHLNGGKLSKCHLTGKTLWKWANGLNTYDSKKKKRRQGQVCLHPGGQYIAFKKSFAPFSFFFIFK